MKDLFEQMALDAKKDTEMMFRLRTEVTVDKHRFWAFQNIYWSDLSGTDIEKWLDDRSVRRMQKEQL
jgi:hypothetical protein